MIFEFAGLPGCGKSTIWGEASQILKKTNITTESLRSHSRRSMVERRKTIRFLKKNAERASLYGFVKFGEQHPETFMTLLDPESDDTSHRMWSLELMAQLWFTGIAGHKGAAILLDEGLVHRGISCLAGRGTTDDAAAFASTLALSHALVMVECSVDFSVERCQQRPGGIPKGFTREEGQPDPDKFNNFEGLLSTATQVLSKSGATILTLDATRPAADLGRELA